MVFLKLLLNTFLTFIAAKAFFTDVQIELYKKYLHDVHNIIPEHYNVQLVPDIELNIFYGECNVSIKILIPTPYLALYSKIECIKNIIVTDNPPKFHDKEMIVYPIKYSYNETNENIEIFFINLISSGHYILNMKYYNIIDDDTELTTFYEQKDEIWLIPRHFDIFGTRQVFPCLSEFFPVTFNISIKHQRDYTALSNMPIQKVEINDEDMLTYFQTTPVLPTYLIAGIVTNFYSNSTKNMITNVWYRNISAIRMVFAQEVIKHITLYLESEWKHLRVISKVNHVTIPNFQDKSMMNLGLVLYREEDIIYDERLDSAARKVDVARVIGSKVSMEWFYNVHGLVSTWSSIWFNDCLIRFFGTYAVHKILPEFRIMDLFVVQFHHESLDFDTTYNISPFNNSFEFSRCIKVSIMLRMLQNILTEKIFWSAIRTYINNNIQVHYLNYINNLMKSLEKSMNDTHLNEINKSVLAVIRIMDPWTKQKYYPTISVKRYYDHPYGKMEVLIKNYNASHYYCIPLTYTIQTNINFDDTFSSLRNKASFLLLPYLQNETESLFFYLSFKEDGWVIFNLQQIGYYRVNYDIENWKRIASYLASENYTKIHVLNRAQIIDDAFHFMITKQLDSSIFWEIAEYLVRETDYVVWYPMFKALEYMSGVLPLPEKKVDVIKTRIRDMLKTQIRNIRYGMFVDTNRFKTCLREEAAKWACILDDFSCKQKANYMLTLHLANPKEHKVLPWWKAWTYCRGLMISSESDLWKTLYRMGMEKSDTKFLEYLACSENFYIIINYLYLRYEQNITKPEYQKHVNSYLFTIAKHANNNNILKYIFLNFDKILPTQVSMAVAMTVIINNIYNKDNFKQITDFMINEYTKAKTAANIDIKGFYDIEKINQTLRNMEQLTKKIENKIKIRYDQIDKQTEYFQNFLITE